MQHQIAAGLGVHVESVKNWERGTTSPASQLVPGIIEFLGYDPRQNQKLPTEAKGHTQ
jgi:transcriptional regulator with XRE-family HTH domain